MDRENLITGFQLDNNLVFNQQIHPIPNIDGFSIINHGKNDL